MFKENGFTTTKVLTIRFFKNLKNLKYSQIERVENFVRQSKRLLTKT